MPRSKKQQKRKIDPLLAALGDTVSKRREELGFSREALADRSGLHRTSIWGIEKGTVNLSLKNLTNLAQALETSAVDLLNSTSQLASQAKAKPRRKPAATPVHILLVEDQPADIFLVKKAFQEIQAYTSVDVVEDGKVALDYLYQKGVHAKAPRPDLILLDLNLPRVSGKDILDKVKSSKLLKDIPVVVLTTSDRDEDIIGTYGLHANCFITKPASAEEFMESIKVIYSFWLNTVSLPPRAG